jgi:hypothetical protein
MTTGWSRRCRSPVTKGNASWFWRKRETDRANRLQLYHRRQAVVHAGRDEAHRRSAKEDAIGVWRNFNIQLSIGRIVPRKEKLLLIRSLRTVNKSLERVISSIFINITPMAQ